MRALAVVVLDVVAENTVEMASPLRSTASRDTPRARCERSVRRRRSPVEPRSASEASGPLRCGHLIEVGAEPAVAVVDKEPHALEHIGGAEVAGLPVTQLPPGLAVQPARWTCRLSTSRKNDT